MEGIFGVVGFGIGVSLGMGAMRVVGFGARALTGVIGIPATGTRGAGAVLITTPNPPEPAPVADLRPDASRRRGKKAGGDTQRIEIAHE
jgi:hypothetical protein